MFCNPAEAAPAAAPQPFRAGLHFPLLGITRQHAEA